MNDIPGVALDAAMTACPDRHISVGRWESAIARHDMRKVLEAAAPHLAAAELERIRQLAESLKFRLYRPAKNGPGGGAQALDVIPAGELLAALRQDAGAYVGGASVDEDVRDERWRDAQI